MIPSPRRPPPDDQPFPAHPVPAPRRAADETGPTVPAPRRTVPAPGRADDDAGHADDGAGPAVEDVGRAGDGPGRVPLRLDADLHVTTGPDGLPAVMARAAARGLAALGIVAAPGPDPGWLDRYLATVRAADAVSPVRISAGLRVALLDPYGRTDLPASVHRELSRVDRIVLVPAGDWVRTGEDVVLAALRAAADLPGPLTLAGPLPELTGDSAAATGSACARAGLTVEVTERWRSPSLPTARALAAAGALLSAGSAAPSAAGVGRWDHVRRVAAALAPVPHPS